MENKIYEKKDTYKEWIIPEEITIKLKEIPTYIGFTIFGMFIGLII